MKNSVLTCKFNKYHNVVYYNVEMITCHAERHVVVFIILVDIAEHVTKVLDALHAGKSQPRGHVVDEVNTLTTQFGRSLRPEVDKVRGHVRRETGYGAVEFQRISGHNESISWL